MMVLRVLRVLREHWEHREHLVQQEHSNEREPSQFYLHMQIRVDGEVTPQKNPDRSLGLRNKKQKTILFAKFLWELFDARFQFGLLTRNLSLSSFLKLLPIPF